MASAYRELQLSLFLAAAGPRHPVSNRAIASRLWKLRFHEEERKLRFHEEERKLRLRSPHRLSGLTSDRGVHALRVTAKIKLSAVA